MSMSTLCRLSNHYAEPGVPCHIASNQQAGRARHMSEVLDYKNLFTREFYSCALGVAKPDIAFFELVLHSLDLRGANVLFLDDRRENVEAASGLGLPLLFTLRKAEHPRFTTYSQSMD